MKRDYIYIGLIVGLVIFFMIRVESLKHQQNKEVKKDLKQLENTIEKMENLNEKLYIYDSILDLKIETVSKERIEIQRNLKDYEKVVKTNKTKNEQKLKNKEIAIDNANANSILDSFANIRK